MAAYARIPVKFVLCQALSLPGQPADRFVSMEDCLREAGLASGLRVGLIGWKLFTEAFGRDHRHMFCVSAFIVEALRNVVGEHIVNATGLLIDPRDGLRLVNDADEIAYLEYGEMCIRDSLGTMRQHRAGLCEQRHVSRRDVQTMSDGRVLPQKAALRCV